MSDESPEMIPDDTSDATEEFDSITDDLATVYNARTERLKVYASLLRATLPRIGAATRLDGGQEAEIDPSVSAYRNLALVALLADIRRIAGEGIAIHEHPETER